MCVCHPYPKHRVLSECHYMVQDVMTLSCSSLRRLLPSGSPDISYCGSQGEAKTPVRMGELTAPSGLCRAPFCLLGGEERQQCGSKEVAWLWNLMSGEMPLISIALCAFKGHAPDFALGEVNGVWQVFCAQDCFEVGTTLVTIRYSLGLPF